jgi:hypothetical protein
MEEDPASPFRLAFSAVIPVSTALRQLHPRRPDALQQFGDAQAHSREIAIEEQSTGTPC